MVTDNGYVGIGQDDPQHPLDITAGALSIEGLEIDNLGSFNLGLDGDLVQYVGSSAAYGIGNNNSTEHWDEVVPVDFVTYTDARAINDIIPINAGLDQILALRPVAYRCKRSITPDDRLRFGLVAQDVENILPNVVIDEDIHVNPETGAIIKQPTDLKAINYMDLIPVLVQSIQEQQEYIKALEEGISRLEED